MSTDPRRAKDLFLAALDRSVEDRSLFLDEACAGDVGLRAAVEQLLAAHAHPASEVNRPLVAPGARDDTAAIEDAARTGTFSSSSADPEQHGEETSLHSGADEHIGAILAGKYKLVEAIGEGGMGSVYMALQTEPVKRVVAVKVIKAGMDSKAVLARFEAERQALAMMDHPNIAKVLDAGTTENGRSFFVMELVKGIPITQFCDERKLTPQQRLELFVPVCNAIQHAHQKGVIHRDIKPSNVLVALYDDRPVPKVIDFGVAKAAGQTLTDNTLLTGFGAVVGTPEYMSPEQASLNNLDIDTRSDVYALGVLLYELLTGSTPVDRKSLGKAALLEILRIVREVEAPRPSVKLATSAALPSVAANRGTEPAKLSKQVRGDLDWIVLKALEKDRSRRYETANGLAADVQRHLAYEPVQAAPPSTAYRLRKFVRKNRGPVLAAGLVLAALLAGIAGTTWGLMREARRVTERDDALRRADNSAKKAEAEAAAARNAEADAQTRARAEAEAKGVAQREKERADEQLRRAQRLVYGNKLSLAVSAFADGNGTLARQYLDEGQWNLRGWEHRYLWTHFNAKQTLSGHTHWVNSVAFSPDGTRLVTGSEDRTAKVWDAAKGTELLTIKGHTSYVASVAFSPDGTRLVTGSYDRTARVWDAEKGQELLNLKGHTGYVTSVAFSPDGTRLVTGSYDRTARVWDAAKGTELLTLTGHASHVTSVAFSPDGTHLVTGSQDNTARVWDAEKGQELVALTGHTSHVASVTFSPDGTRLATGSEDQTARVWDAEKGQELFVLMGHTAGVSSVAFSPDGTRLVTGSLDTTAKVWDTEKGTELLTLKGITGSVSSVAFSPDGKRLAAGSYNHTAEVWDAEKGQEVFTLKGHTSDVGSVAFSPDGTRLFAWDKEKKLLAWSLRDGQTVDPARPPAMSPPGSATSPDGRLRAEPRGDTVAVFDPIRVAKDNLWPLPDVAERRRYHTEQAAVAEKEKRWFAVAFHVGRLLLDAPDDATLKPRREEALRRHTASVPVPVGPPVIELAK